MTYKLVVPASPSVPLASQTLRSRATHLALKRKQDKLFDYAVCLGPPSPTLVQADHNQDGDTNILMTRSRSRQQKSTVWKGSTNRHSASVDLHHAELEDAHLRPQLVLRQHAQLATMTSCGAIPGRSRLSVAVKATCCGDNVSAMNVASSLCTGHHAAGSCYANEGQCEARSRQ